MNNKKKIKRFIVINRFVYWSLFIFMALFTIFGVKIISEKLTPDNVTLLNHSASKNYYELLNESVVDMSLKFDWPCSGKVTVSFYDIGDNLLCTKTETFDTIGGYSTFLLDFRDIDGEVDHYKIISIEAIPDEYPYGIYIQIAAKYIAILFLIFAIVSLWLKCRTFKFEDREIVVYVGWVKILLFENDVLMDDYKSSFRFSPVTVRYTDNYDNNIEVRVSGINHITLKINNRLYKQE